MQEELLNLIFRLYQFWGVFFGFNIILKFSVSCQCMLASAFLSLARNRIWKTHFLYPVINRIDLSQYSICNSHVSKINCLKFHFVLVA